MHTPHATNGQTIKQNTTFSSECTVTIGINAPAETVWALLTDPAEIVRWNSTIISLDGRIAVNETINLKATVSPDRTFNLRITEMTAPAKMVWEDGMAPMFKGVRTYTVHTSGGTVEFTMREVFKGVMLPMIRRSLPDFGPSFEQFAADLKHAAEAANQENN